jgi:hypothetical protein
MDEVAIYWPVQSLQPGAAMSGSANPGTAPGQHRLRCALWMAEDEARELPNLPLEDALQFMHLHAERGSPKFEPAANAVTRALRD